MLFNTNLFILKTFINGDKEVQEFKFSTLNEKREIPYNNYPHRIEYIFRCLLITFDYQQFEEIVKKNAFWSLFNPISLYRLFQRIRTTIPDEPYILRISLPHKTPLTVIFDNGHEALCVAKRRVEKSVYILALDKLTIANEMFYVYQLFYVGEFNFDPNHCLGLVRPTCQCSKNPSCREKHRQFLPPLIKDDKV